MHAVVGSHTRSRVWSLEFRNSLELGAWSLELGDTALIGLQLLESRPGDITKL